MALAFSTFLMFTGSAEQAMELYSTVFSDAVIESIERYGPEEPDREGLVKAASFTLRGQRFRCFDSPPVHDFTFTPAISIFVDCETEDELESAYAQLASGGAVLMPIGEYGFSTRFGWVNDRFGVSWQLNFA
ncbi:MAG TPA: VOC family protein [Coriobacteriia bacterium]|nr:VOC family protein [Coriobacteriia bacterium]